MLVGPLVEDAIGSMCTKGSCVSGALGGGRTDILAFREQKQGESRRLLWQQVGECG
jgi:hypothetical protein